MKGLTAEGVFYTNGCPRILLCAESTARQDTEGGFKADFSREERLKLRKLLKAGAGRLQAAWGQGEDARRESETDARLLLFYAAGCTLSAWPLRMDEEAEPGVCGRYLAMIERRGRHEPLQYITGEAPFYGRDFIVRPGVLIPRFDTETLVAEVLPALRPGQRILDLCTGSGCILVTLLLEGPAGIRGTGADISGTALAVARENASRFGSDASFVKSNLYENIHGVYDIITANPPYIPRQDIAALAPEVRVFEPGEALDGGRDGLSFYRRIVRGAPMHLKENGTLAFEIGCDEAGAVTGIMREGGFENIKTVQDLAGRDRCVTGTRK